MERKNGGGDGVDLLQYLFERAALARDDKNENVSDDKSVVLTSLSRYMYCATLFRYHIKRLGIVCKLEVDSVA